MSIVSVHGPNTMFGTGAGGPGTGASVTNAGGTVTADISNGYKFTLAVKGDRPAADYDWTFSGGAGAAAQPDTKNGTVTFTDAGAKVITLTVGSSGGTTPPAAAYVFNVTAAAGPRSVEPEGDTTVPQGDNTVVYDEEAYGNFILADHSLGEIQDFISHYELTEDDWDALVDEESSGADRPEVLDWFNETRP